MKSEADILYTSAQNILNKKQNFLSKLFFPFDMEDSLIRATDLLEESGQKYLIEKEYDSFIKTCDLRIDTFIKLKDNYSVCLLLQKMGDFYSRRDIDKSIECYQRAITYAHITKKFQLYMSIIKLNEKLGKFDLVIKLCEELLDNYVELITPHQCKEVGTKLADLYYANGNYFKAGEIYKKIVLENESSIYLIENQITRSIRSLILSERTDQAIELHHTYGKKFTNYYQSKIGSDISKILEENKEENILYPDIL